MRIPRMSDRFKITIGELEFLLAPASYFLKKEIAECTRISAGKQVFDLAKAQFIYIKHCLKDVKGLEGYDGEEYGLSFENDCLTDDCVSEIFNIPVKEKLMIACWGILGGATDEIVDPQTGEKIEGVQLDIITSKKPPS